jgi:hypothetical protein
MEKAQTMSLMKNLEYLLQKKVCPFSQVHIPLLIKEQT